MKASSSTDKHGVGVQHRLWQQWTTDLQERLVDKVISRVIDTVHHPLLDDVKHPLPSHSEQRGRVVSQ